MIESYRLLRGIYKNWGYNALLRFFSGQMVPLWIFPVYSALLVTSCHSAVFMLFPCPSILEIVWGGYVGGSGCAVHMDIYALADILFVDEAGFLI